MVVVAVRGARNVVNPGGAVLYISTEPLAQLTPLEMAYIQGWVGIVAGRIPTLVDKYSDRYTRPKRWIEGEQRMKRYWAKPETKSREAGQVYASRRERRSRLIMPTR